MLVIATSFYLAKQNELGRATRGLYAADSVFFYFEGAVDTGRLDWSKLHTDKSYTVFREMDNVGGTIIRGYYFRKDTFRPNIIKGVFFNENDFYRGQQKAVVGKNIFKSAATPFPGSKASDNIIISEQGKEYYIYDGSKFEVIGVMGEAYDAKLDNMVLLNMDALHHFRQQHANFYVLDQEQGMEGEGKSRSIRIGNDKFPIEQIDMGTIGVNEYVGNHDQWIVMVMIFLFICSSILLTYNWLKKKKSEQEILEISGIHMACFYAQKAIEYYAVAFFSYLSSVLLMSILTLVYDRNVEGFYRYVIISSVLVTGMIVLSYHIAKKMVSSQFKSRKGFPYDDHIRST